jgi:hypothetical protein
MDEVSDAEFGRVVHGCRRRDFLQPVAGAAQTYASMRLVRITIGLFPDPAVPGA